MRGWSWKWGILVGVAALTMVGATKVRKLARDAAKKVYVAPGEYDEFYAFMSGGFNGQIGVHGLPSGRLLKIVPVFSVNPENGYGYSEETKPFLMIPSHDLIVFGVTSGQI